jgi:hypothetical protein
MSETFPKRVGRVIDAVPAGVALGLLLVWISQPPTWGLLATLTICIAVFYAVHIIKRDLARIKCELSGHWHAEFKKKYDDAARCPRCEDIIRTRAPGNDGPGMQVGEDTLHQRICRLEAVLGAEE